ncbi:2-dehydro-3-deoxy-D-gluconate 5-dehydrogenase [Poriferisphaera corsica]|uniref:2-dehydro-3-deoxy-D-gluconate 5-dehydrogenase n=1 Tax=Poriferisphaera corsica TaxID=2528020 RepID=A0A517YXY2_9BACT|nr:glucose 1-dehydrogenase [Poriferisphaera corsica]QDU35090.1 2-dehydro-3-deoxy-D-gluconate 5-dehydrogenase [Poriferisphaera corsica]
MSITTELFDLTGKVALVTGGATGIGKAIAKVFIEHGCKVVVGSRTLANVEQAAQELNTILEHSDEIPMAAGVSLDVADDDSVQKAVDFAIDTFGSLDILVNSAGIMCKKPTADLSADEMNNLYNIHVTGSLRASQAAAHIFREQHAGCIINIASVASYCSLTEVTAYASAKSATMGLTRSLANEWAKYGIRTNGIAPGFVPTDINRKMIEGTDRGRRIIENTPMARFGTSDEIAGAAVYLASRAGQFVNGHTIVVDGGYLACGIGDTFAPWAQPSEA